MKAQQKSVAVYERVPIERLHDFYFNHNHNSDGSIRWTVQRGSDDGEVYFVAIHAGFIEGLPAEECQIINKSIGIVFDDLDCNEGSSGANVFKASPRFDTATEVMEWIYFHEMQY